MEPIRLNPHTLDPSELRQRLQSATGPQHIILEPGLYREPLTLVFEPGDAQPPHWLIESEVPGGAVFTGADEYRAWQMVGANRWRLPFVATAEQRLEKHFGVITQPVQVFVEDRRLQLARSMEDLSAGSFFYDGEAVWMQLDEGKDPRSGGVEVACRERMLHIKRDHVTVSGIVVTRCASSLQRGGFLAEGRDLTVQDCEFSQTAAGVGAHFKGARLRIERNRFHHNGQMGFGFRATDSIFIDNEVRDNDLRNFCSDPDAEWNVWESGGGKVVYSRNCLFRGNRFIDNRNGPGLWLDIDNFHNRIDGNYFSGNGHSSIMIEISWDNTVTNNIICDTHQSNYAAAAILVQLSCRTKIYHNLILRSEGYGVHLRWHVRQRDIHPYEIDDSDEFEKAYGFRKEDWMAADGDYPVNENDIRNNCFVDCLGGAIGNDVHPTLTNNNASDCNLFWNARSLHPMAGGHRLLEWQETTGFDMHSIYEKEMHKGPLFHDVAKGDYRPHPDGPLAQKVPAIKDCPEDFLGETRPGQSTIGPFELK
jgi:parallel beta-helix repeat protein